MSAELRIKYTSVAGKTKTFVVDGVNQEVAAATVKALANGLITSSTNAWMPDPGAEINDAVIRIITDNPIDIS